MRLVFLFVIFAISMAVTYADDAYLLTTGDRDNRNPVWSFDGNWIAYESFNDYLGIHEIWKISATGGTPIQVTEYEFALHPSWSPDGTKIAFGGATFRGYDQIFIIPANGGDVTQLTYESSNCWGPNWSHDGNYVSFSSTDYVINDIYTIPATGGAATRITTNSSDDKWPTWSADGSNIAFASDRTGEYGIWSIPSGGGTPTQITDEGVNPDWSFGGSSIAFSLEINGNRDIYIVPAAGGTPIRVTDNPASDYSPSWSPDGSKIAFHSNRNGIPRVWIIDVSDIVIIESASLGYIKVMFKE